MRRTTVIALIVALAALAAGCSSSSETATSTTAAPTTEVAEVNKSACAGLAEYDALVKAGVPDRTGKSDVEGATILQGFLASLSAPLATVKAVGPAELGTNIDVLQQAITTNTALDPADPATQAAVSAAILAPSSEVAAANTYLRTWSKDHCNLTIARGQ